MSDQGRWCKRPFAHDKRASTPATAMATPYQAAAKFSCFLRRFEFFWSRSAVLLGNGRTGWLRFGMKLFSGI